MRVACTGHSSPLGLAGDNPGSQASVMTELILWLLPVGRGWREHESPPGGSRVA
jgi:hypothetical protein